MQSNDNGESWVGLDTLELNNFSVLNGRTSLQINQNNNLLVAYSTFDISDSSSSLELLSKNLITTKKKRQKL